MTKDEINEEACEYCNQVMCSVCENRTCDNAHLATLKCREWRDRRAGYYCGVESREKRITELEKKNSELKEEIQNNEDLATVAYMQGAESQKKKYEKWLIKGKELLNEFMRISKASDEDFEHDYSELIGETETFLKEVSE